MQFTTKGSDELAETTLVRSMDVFVIWLWFELVGDQYAVGVLELATHDAVLPFLTDAFESINNLITFLLGQYAYEAQCLGICDGTFDIGGMHSLIIFQRLIKFVHAMYLDELVTNTGAMDHSQRICRSREPASP